MDAWGRFSRFLIQALRSVSEHQIDRFAAEAKGIDADPS
jgi:hypothetical protein